MELWRKAFLRGIAPALGRDALAALRGGLAANDPRIIRGATTDPFADRDWSRLPCNGACAVGFAVWQADNLTTAGEVEDHFLMVAEHAATLYDSEPRRGRKGGLVRDSDTLFAEFINWFDETPPHESYPQLIEAIDEALAAMPK